MSVFTINAVPSIIPEAPTATMEYVCFNVACAKEPGVEAVVILPITPRSKEASAKSRHHWRPDFEEARLAVNSRVTELVRAMPRVMTWRHVGGLNSTRFLLHDGVHMRWAFQGETYDIEAALQRLHVA